MDSSFSANRQALETAFYRRVNDGADFFEVRQALAAGRDPFWPVESGHTVFGLVFNAWRTEPSLHQAVLDALLDAPSATPRHPPSTHTATRLLAEQMAQGAPSSQVELYHDRLKRLGAHVPSLPEIARNKLAEKVACNSVSNSLPDIENLLRYTPPLSPAHARAAAGADGCHRLDVALKLLCHVPLRQRAQALREALAPGGWLLPAFASSHTDQVEGTRWFEAVRAWSSGCANALEQSVAAVLTAAAETDPARIQAWGRALSPAKAPPGAWIRAWSAQADGLWTALFPSTCLTTSIARGGRWTDRLDLACEIAHALPKEDPAFAGAWEMWAAAAQALRGAHMRGPPGVHTRLLQRWGEKLWERGAHHGLTAAPEPNPWTVTDSALTALHAAVRRAAVQQLLEKQLMNVPKRALLRM